MSSLGLLILSEVQTHESGLLFISWNDVQWITQASSYNVNDVFQYCYQLEVYVI